MKKVFLMPLALLSVLLLFVSCETDSGGGSDGLVITLDKTSYTYSSSNPKLKLESDNYSSYKDKLDIIIVNESTEEEEISFNLEKNDKWERWDLELTGVDKTRTCEYTLYYGTDANQTVSSRSKLAFTVTVGSSTTTYVTPVITTQPVGAEYNKGATADALTVVAECSDGLKYQWYKNGSAISAATDTSYTPTADGKYYVRVSNSKNSNYYVDSDTVSITFINTNVAAPTITLNSSSAKYDSISSASALSATITGGSGTLHVQWYKNGAAFGDEKTSTESSYTTTVTPDAFTTYYVVAWNESTSDGNSATTTSDVITISESTIVITITPDWSGSSATLGTTLSVTATTNVESTISYQWYKHDSQSSSDVPDQSIGATSKSFTPTEAGTYFCRVTAVSKATGTQKTSDSGNCYVESNDSTDETGTGGINIDFGSSN